MGQSRSQHRFLELRVGQVLIRGAGHQEEGALQPESGPKLEGVHGEENVSGPRYPAVSSPRPSLEENQCFYHLLKMLSTLQRESQNYPIHLVQLVSAEALLGLAMGQGPQISDLIHPYRLAMRP